VHVAVPVARAAALALTLVAAVPARAQEDPAEDAEGDPAAAVEAPAEPADAPAEPADAPAADGSRKWTLELGGRVFVRDTVSRVDVGEAVWRHDRAIDQARVSAVYDRKRLRLSIEVDFAGDDAQLKDTYIRVRPIDALRIQAGRFKPPISFIGLESKWRLPSIERGLLSELELDDRDLPFAGGRGEGLSMELRPPLPLEPRLTAALMQSPLASGLSPVDPSEEVTQDLFVRAAIEPLTDLHLAASFALVGYHEQLGQADSFGHLAMASAEVHVDARHLRVWLEAFTGQSFAYQPDGTLSGSFVAGRALLSPRLRQVPGLHRLEPYAGASLFDPTDDIDGDRVSELVGGVNIAFSRYWRVQLEAAQRIAEGLASPVADSSLFRLQLGASFAEGIQ
jgi:hypothetical protein